MPENGPPSIPSFEDDMAAESEQVRQDMLLTERSVLEGLPLE